MKKVDIKLGGLYTARISGFFVTVRVDAIREITSVSAGSYHGWTCRERTRTSTVYDITNLRTGRKTTFRNASKFRSVASAA